mgnify:CR=1 FL=1
MRYVRLGNSDLMVSRICMGCMGFGDAQNGQHTWTLDEEHSREIIKRGLELGVNFFDTAIAYQSVQVSATLDVHFVTLRKEKMSLLRQNFFHEHRKKI